MIILLLLLIIAATACTSILIYIKFVGSRHVSEIHDLKSALTTAKKLETALRDQVNILQVKVRDDSEDSVTHLLSWKLFSDRLSQSIRDSARNEGYLAVLYVDIDNFQSINNAYNHEIGNELLRLTAERLKTCLRQVDSISRLTKDTFVILLTQLTKPELSAIVAQRILQAFLEPIIIKDLELHITLSIGIALYPADGQTDLLLLKNAEQALMLAKKRGKHIYQFYQEEMYSLSQREAAISSELNKPTVFSEFTLNYQPVMDSTTQEIVVMDVQLSWHHPTLGYLTFGDLIPFLDQQRKLNMVIEWIISNACKQYLHWRSLGFNSGIVGISLPIKALENSQIIYRITQLLQSLEFKPEWLLIELVTDQEMPPMEALDKAFNIMRYVGLRIAVSEFGAGNISFKQLKLFPVDYIMLSKFLIDDIEVNERSAILARSIIQLSNNLGIQVVAQGVETSLQVSLLEEYGCHLMQGRIIAEPLSDKEVDSKIGEQA